MENELKWEEMVKTISATAEALSGLTAIVSLSMLQCKDTDEKVININNTTELKGCIIDIKNAAELCKGKSGLVAKEDKEIYAKAVELNEMVLTDIETISSFYI